MRFDKKALEEQYKVKTIAECEQDLMLIGFNQSEIKELNATISNMIGPVLDNLFEEKND